MKRFSIAVILAIASTVAGGCESSSTPVSPAGVGNEPGATFTLSGVVTEVTATGVTPVDRAFVQETRSQLGATTDVDGSYRIPGLSSGRGVVRIVKEGYVTSTSNVDITADARLDVRIVPIRTYILSGVVFEITESGRVAVEDVELYCDSCGSPVGHTFTSTDAEGHYSFAWSMNGVHALLVRKDGYALARADGNYGSGTEYILANVTGDTQVDIEVVRR
jgi:Carboxypeptidase regulatory-like domain